MDDVRRLLSYIGTKRMWYRFGDRVYGSFYRERMITSFHRYTRVKIFRSHFTISSFIYQYLILNCSHSKPLSLRTLNVFALLLLSTTSKYLQFSYRKLLYEPKSFTPNIPNNNELTAQGFYQPLYFISRNEYNWLYPITKVKQRSARSVRGWVTG